jgi:predicted hotdog family 3-hydroxylacyl-ACP dehydratase
MTSGRNPEQMAPISGKKLVELIPQKPPFVLIGSLLEVSEKTCVTTFKIDAAHVLFHNGKMSTAGLMENIAQTAAAKMGYECFLENKKIPIGFIGDVRDFTFTRLPKADEEITTQIVIDNKIFDATMITGKVKLGDEIIATCKMKIFVEPEKKTAEQPAQL